LFHNDWVNGYVLNIVSPIILTIFDLVLG